MLVLAGCNLGVPADVYQVTASGNSATDVVLGDLDNDGHVDIVTASQRRVCRGPGRRIGQVRGDGDHDGPVVRLADRGVMVATADLDGNGQPDLVYAQAEVMRVLLNHLDGRRTRD